MEQDSVHPDSPGSRDEQILQFIRDIDGGMTVIFEARLAQMELLGQLEEAGILPTVVQPNPYDPDIELALAEEWWEQNPQQADAFHEAAERRREIMKYILIGAVLGRSYADIFALGKRKQTE